MAPGDDEEEENENLLAESGEETPGVSISQDSMSPSQGRLNSVLFCWIMHGHIKVTLFSLDHSLICSQPQTVKISSCEEHYQIV